MTEITFSRLRDSEDWGLRGAKASPDEKPPEEGATVTVTRRNGETQDVEMGRVIAQGDDWWLATVGGAQRTKPDQHRSRENEQQLARLTDAMRELHHEVNALKHRVTELEQQPSEHDRNADAAERAAIETELFGDEPREANPWA
jgi:hypothetical protein